MGPPSTSADFAWSFVFDDGNELRLVCSPVEASYQRCLELGRR
jgi:hypothetical protein